MQNPQLPILGGGGGGEEGGTPGNSGWELGILGSVLQILTLSQTKQSHF